MNPTEKKLAYQTQVFMRRKAMSGASPKVLRTIKRALDEHGIDRRTVTGSSHAREATRNHPLAGGAGRHSEG